VPIIRRNNCVLATLGTCYSVWMIVCIPDSHPHKNTVVSPDDGHIVVRNMQRLINIIRINLCTKLILFTKLRLTLSV
jgi:hypothetical protein